MGQKTDGIRHTKGPWEYGRKKKWTSQDGAARLADDDGYWFGPVGHKHDIGQVYAVPDQDGEEQEANARLIVAAPDFEAGMAHFILLAYDEGDCIESEVVEWCRSVLRGEKRTGAQIYRDAIAKATASQPVN